MVGLLRSYLPIGYHYGLLVGIDLIWEGTLSSHSLLIGAKKG